MATISANDLLVSTFDLQPFNDNGVRDLNCYNLPAPLTLQSFRSTLTELFPLLATDILTALPSELLDSVELSALQLRAQDTGNQLLQETTLVISTPQPINLNQSVSILPAIQAASVIINITTGGKADQWSTKVSGLLIFGSGADSVLLEVVIDLPTGNLSANLLSPVKLAGLMGTLNFPEGLDSNLSVSNMALSANVSTGACSFSITIADVFKYTTAIDGTTYTLDLEQVSLSYDNTSGTAVRTLAAKTLFTYKNKIGFDIYLSKSFGAQTDLVFSGSLAAGQSIKLSDFIDIGEVPAPLQNLAVDKLYVNYTTGNSFAFGGSIADLLTWDHNAFEVSFDYSRTYKNFTGTWQNQNGKPFDSSSYNFAGLASLVKPIQASLSLTLAGGTDTAVVSLVSLLEMGQSASPPVLNMVVSKATGSDGTSTTSVNGTLQFGTLSFTLDMQKKPDSNQFSASYLDQSGTFNLGELLTQVLAYLGDGSLPPVIPAVNCQSVSLQYTSQNKSFSFTASSGQKTTIDIANRAFDIDFNTTLNTSLNPQTGKRTYNGSLTGQLQLGSMLFDITFDIGSAKAITGSWTAATPGDYIDFRMIPQCLNMWDGGFNIPADFDITLKQLVLELNITTSMIKVSALTQSNLDAFFIASHTDNGWGFAFGLAISGNCSANQLQGIGSSLDAVKFLQVKTACLLISTMTDPQFSLGKLSLPAMPASAGAFGKTQTSQMPAQVSGANFPGAGAGTLPLKPGVLVAFEVDLNTSSNPLITAFKNIANGDTLTFCADISTTMQNSYVGAFLGDPFNIKLGKDQIKLSQAALMIYFSGEFRITGSVQIPSGTNNIEATASLDLSATGAQCTLVISNDSSTGQPQAIPLPFGLAGLKLDQFAFEMGMVFEPAALDLGVAGKFHIINQPVASNDFALVISLEEEVPNIDYFSCYIAELDVKEVVVAATGNLNPSLPDVFNQVRASQLSLYWCDDPVTLPDNTMAQVGFGFNGLIDVFGFKAFAHLNLSTSGGISGSAEMSPITYGPMTVIGTGKGVTVKGEMVNGVVIPATRPLPPGQSANIQLYQVVPPGGPFINITAGGSPYFNVSFQFSLFNFIKESIEAEISNTGLSFELGYMIGGIDQCTFTCLIGKDNFAGSADFDLGIRADIDINIGILHLGPWHVDTGFDTSFNVAIDSAGFDMKINASFHFDGFHMHIPQIELKETISSLEELPGKIKDQLLASAQSIFSDITGEASRILDGAKKVADDIAKGAERAATAIKDTADKAGEAIKNEAVQIAGDVSKGIVDTEKAIGQAEQQTKQIISDGVQAVKQVAKQADDDINEAIQKVAAIPGEVAKIGTQLGDDVAKVAEQCAAKVAQIGRDVVAAVSNIINDAKQMAQTILGDAAQAASTIVHSVDAWVNQAKQFAEQVFNRLAKKFGQAVNDMVKGFTALTGYFAQVGPAIVQKAVQWLASAANTIKNGITSAANAVGGFFRYLF